MSFEKKLYAQVTFCDLSKAFDCVDGGILIHKLNHYGIHGSPLNFLESYLHNRTQMVHANGEWSEEVKVTWGVPQGSVLGPLLFLIYINDLPLSVNSKTILYADDTTFLNFNSDMSNLEDIANDTLKNATNWFESNGLLLNQDKTQNIIFSLRHTNNSSQNQKFSKTVKFLGVFIDDLLTWTPHIDYLTTRLSRVIYLLGRLNNVVPQNYIRSAYFAYFQSVFRYGLILFGNCSRIQDILILQKKILRTFYKSEPREHCKPLFVDFQIQTVVNLYIFDSINYVYKNQDLIKPLNHSHNTRNKANSRVEFCRLSKTLKSHSIMTLKIFNILQDKINSYSAKEFLNKFYLWLLENPFYSLDEFLTSDNIDF